MEEEDEEEGEEDDYTENLASAQDQLTAFIQCMEARNDNSFS